jgi:hypothetical protein
MHPWIRDELGRLRAQDLRHEAERARLAHRLLSLRRPDARRKGER